MRDHRQRLFQPLARLPAQRVDPSVCKPGRDRFARVSLEGTDEVLRIHLSGKLSKFFGIFEHPWCVEFFCKISENHEAPEELSGQGKLNPTAFKQFIMLFVGFCAVFAGSS